MPLSQVLCTVNKEGILSRANPHVERIMLLDPVKPESESTESEGNANICIAYSPKSVTRGLGQIRLTFMNHGRIYKYYHIIISLKLAGKNMLSVEKVAVY